MKTVIFRTIPIRSSEINGYVKIYLPSAHKIINQARLLNDA